MRIITIGNVNPTVQIMIDRKDGENITVDDCAAVSRAVSSSTTSMYFSRSSSGMAPSRSACT